ncbi:DUF4381 domain-containing protein [bacterium]|nr:DUF4381 domain-containing protein [bacterium]
MDSLAQLKEIHLPDQVHNYPLAPGWWILAFIVTALIIFFIVKWVKSYRLAKAKRQAIKLLSNIDDNEENQNNEIMGLLKWAALQYFSRDKIAPLFGSQLQLFLKNSLPDKLQNKFIELSESAFEHRYQIDELSLQDQTLKKAALLWLQNALPPQKVLTEKVLTEKVLTEKVVTKTQQASDEMTTKTIDKDLRNDLKSEAAK